VTVESGQPPAPAASAGPASDAIVGQAVLFFEDGRIAGEFRLAEFQALIDGAAAAEQFAGRRVPAVYVEVGAALVVRALVFFEISVDVRGVLDRNFNLPIEDLARRAGLGPDLGNGRVRLACRGQCSISWFAAQLWQPKSLGPEGECALVQRTMLRNKLAFRATTGSPASAAGEPLDRRFKDVFGATGRINVPQIIRQYQAQIEPLKEERDKLRSQLRVAKVEVTRLRAELNQERERSRRLETLLRGSENR
jgi:hypothetical protein